MLEQIKNKIQSPEFRSDVKTFAVNVATTVVAAIVIKTVVYIAVEGSKALIENIGNTQETPAE